MVISGVYLRGGVNDKMVNVHHASESQQGQPINSAPPNKPEPKSPKIPPLPPSSFNSLKTKSGPIINTELLKSMSKKLRKPDGNNIRKIPRRKDMMIPTKVTKTAEEDTSMQPPAHCQL
jgi:hypothetical protein